MDAINNHYNCPYCGSKNTCKLSLIYENGIFHANGVVLNHQNFGKSSFSGTNQTRSSHNAAPPEDPSSFLIWGILIGIMIWLAGYVIISQIVYMLIASNSNLLLDFTIIPVRVILFVIMPILIIKDIIVQQKYKMEKYRLLFEKWNKAYKCQRCDRKFIVSN
jgi:DNA-directed RNA polymerase subunit RPC12/RpoP